MATKLIPPPETDLHSNEDGEGKAMSFFEHLEELRIRLFRAVLAVAVGMLISVVVTDPVLNYLQSAYGAKLIILDPVDSIAVFFRVALLLGAILASPIITYQIFMFVMPGLTRQEKTWVLRALPATTALFLFGVVFTWFLLVPAYINFLKGFEANIFTVTYSADNYISFITSVLFWHGVAFETPVVFFILGKLGVVTAGTMLHYWRHAVVAATAISAFITPTIDPLTMLVVAGILVALYFLSVILVGITTGFRKTPARTS
jgi:sec-independent protein translocase protein TatC